MLGKIQIRQAAPEDADVVAGILTEAAQWLEREGMPLWREAELTPKAIAAEVAAGLFFLAESSGDPAGTVRFQLEDPFIWPDAPRLDAAYVHRLAVRRRYAGTGLSSAILSWAVAHTRELGRRILRLDCEASRPRLRWIYESFGFVHHSDHHAGPYFVSRYEFDATRLPTKTPSHESGGVSR
jgi:GNAT superfamily N-acetyltransferase